MFFPLVGFDSETTSPALFYLSYRVPPHGHEQWKENARKNQEGEGDIHKVTPATDDTL